MSDLDEQSHYRRTQLAIMAASGLSSQQKLLLIAISNSTKDDEFGMLTADELQKATVLSAGIVSRVTQELADTGVLFVVLKPGDDPRYRIDLETLTGLA